MTPKLPAGHMARGRFLTAAERRNRIVLDSVAAKRLFPQQDSVGRELTLGDQTFSVVGVLAPGKSVDANDADMMVIVPISSTFSADPSPTRLDEIWMIVDPTQLDTTREEVVNILGRNHPEKDFEVEAPTVAPPSVQRNVDRNLILYFVLGLVCTGLALLAFAAVMIAMVVWRVRARGRHAAAMD
jgi:putative ABC transport system permease protein